jgi:rod shape-determining protein MreC
MFKKRFFIFIVFILVIFAVLTYQGMKGGLDASRFAFLNYPLKILEQGISISIKSIKNLFRNYILVVGREDKDGRQEIDQERNQCLEAKYENERLRALLELKSQRANYITTAEVFARDPTNWFQILWINKGRDDGIAKDMIAVTPLGIVGRIHKVFADSATVILITDVNSSVAARIQSSRIEGILEGRGDKRCYLKYVPQEADVIVGDRVITSGLEGIYPEGLQIGYVVDINKRPGEFFQVIEVAPAQHLSAVEEVALLKIGDSYQR